MNARSITACGSKACSEDFTGATAAASDLGASTMISATSFSTTLGRRAASSAAAPAAQVPLAIADRPAAMMRAETEEAFAMRAR